MFAHRVGKTCVGNVGGGYTRWLEWDDDVLFSL